jgi:hypothetical protein
MARWRIAWLLILISALALAVAGVRPAHGKGDAWIITGGELGEYATVIGFERDAPGTERLADNTRPPPETPYHLYSANGVFTTAAGFAEQPILRYYPKAHILESLNAQWVDQRWTLLAPQTARDLDAVITVAIWKRDRGELALGLTAANWTWRDMSNARYTFTPIGRADLAVAIDPPDSAELAMRHLVDTVSRPPAGMTEARPAYTVTIQGLGQVNWGGQLGSYSPPKDGQPGKFWAEGPAASGPSEYYTATPGLDQFIAGAVARASLLRSSRSVLAVEQPLRWSQVNGSPWAPPDAQLAHFPAARPAAGPDPRGSEADAHRVTIVIGSIVLGLAVVAAGFASGHHRARRRR